MNRHRLIVLALAGGLLTATIPSLAHAQIADALVYAEQTCLSHGIAPYSAAFNACVERAALAYDRSRPVIGERATRSDCLRYAIEPHTLGHCATSEIDRRSVVASASRLPPYAPTYSVPPYSVPPYSVIAHPNAR